MSRSNPRYQQVFGSLRVRSTAQGVLVSCYYTTPVFEALDSRPLPPRLRVHRLCLPRFRWGQDYAEYFDGLDVGRAKVVFDGTVEPRNLRKFEFLDRRVAIGRTYAYWVSSPAGRTPTGPAGIRPRDPRIWWSHRTIHERLQALVERYPGRVEPMVCGTTVGGRELTALLAGNPRRRIALVGAVHAGESGPELLFPALERLLERESALLDQVGVALLPSVDADERDRLASGCPWYLRTNARGVDLNRNFDADWDVADRSYGLVSDDPDAQTWRGPAPDSEPETQAVVRLLDGVRPAAVFSYHALAGITGATFLAPRKADGDEPYLRRCRELTDAYRGAFYPEQTAFGGLRCGTSGGSLPAYAYQKLRVPAFDLEWDGNPAYKGSHSDLTTPAMLADCRERHCRGLAAVLRTLRRNPVGKLLCGGLAAVCAGILLPSAGFAAPAVPAAEAAPPANAGITMAYHRNFFSGSMNHLMQLVADKVEPSGSVVLKTFEARDWWTQTRTTELSRLYALNLHGFIVPDADGEYRFFAEVRGQMRFFLSPDADAARAVPLPFAPAPVATNGQGAAAACNQVSPPVALQAGKARFVRVLFIPGWQERLNILWARKTAGGVETEPEPMTGTHLRTRVE